MNTEKKKKIILGVTGGIAAYKSAGTLQPARKASYDVHVIMTASAQKLMTERCFLTLSRNPVICNLWDVPEWRPEHIELSESADLLVVAPCTANFIGKYTHGIADDALTTTAMRSGGKSCLPRNEYADVGSAGASRKIAGYSETAAFISSGRKADVSPAVTKAGAGCPSPPISQPRSDGC